MMTVIRIAKIVITNPLRNLLCNEIIIVAFFQNGIRNKISSVIKYPQ